MLTEKKQWTLCSGLPTQRISQAPPSNARDLPTRGFTMKTDEALERSVQTMRTSVLLRRSYALAQAPKEHRLAAYAVTAMLIAGLALILPAAVSAGAANLQGTQTTYTR